MIEGIDHIGIAVNNLEEAMELYGKIFAVQNWHREHVHDQGVDIASCVVGTVRIELTAASRADSPITKFIEKRGQGIHHLAVRSTDIRADLADAERNGIKLIDHQPRKGAHNMQIAFLHPSSTGGVLIEYCTESRDE